MIEQALEHYRAGRWSEAESLFRQMLEDEPDNPEVLFMLSLVCRQQNDLDEAAEHIGRAVQIHPQNATYHHALGSVALQRQDLPDALAAFGKAVDLDPNYTEAQTAIAYCHLLNRDYATAENAARIALRAKPDHAPALVNLGIALLEQEQAANAIGYLQQAVQLEPENAGAQMQLGRAFMSRNQAAFAAQCFKNALERSPSNIELLQLHANAREKIGDFEGAVENYRSVLDQGVETADTLGGLARLTARIGDGRAAENLFLRALHVAPDRHDVRLSYARYLYEQERYRDAYSRLRPIVESDADLPKAGLLLAETAFHLGRIDEALNLVKPLLTAADVPADARLLLARILFAQSENAAAVSQLDKLLAMDTPPVEAQLLQLARLSVTQDWSAASDLLAQLRRRPDLTASQRRRVSCVDAQVMHHQEKYQSAWERLLAVSHVLADTMKIRSEVPLRVEQNQPAETAMSREVAWSWPPQAPDDGRADPVFLFAWPGSGRRRLLSALRWHPQIQLVDDSAVRQSERRLAVSHPQGRDPLSNLREADILLARRRYWKKLKSSLSPLRQDAMLVDGMWLTAESLPSIYRYFPQAKMIVLTRNAKDMAVSWMFEAYADLEDMAEYYTAQLDLLTQSQAGVPLKYLTVEHEELQRNPGDVLRNLTTELGLAWHQGVEDVYAGTREAHILPINSWQFYSDWLDSVFVSLD